MGFIAAMASSVISSGQQTGSQVEGFDDAESVSIWAPAALTGTITIQASPDIPEDCGGPTAANATWATMQSGGADITIAASKMLTFTDISFRRLRMVSGSAEGADRTFKIVKQVYPAAPVRY